jgi:hypothetical protein
MAYPTPINPAPLQGSGSIQELSAPLYQARGWLKFLGVLSIIGGIVQVITIAGIISGALSIWMGVLLFQAGTSIETAGHLGDRFAFLNSLGHLKTYFMIQGILTLLAIILVLAAVCIMVILPIMGVTLFSLPSINNIVY